MENANRLNIEVAYALPDQQTLIEVQVPAESTAEEAIRASGLLEKHPEIDLGNTKIGIFGKLAKLDAPLTEGDRVEIYRQLIADPKEMRKKQAAVKAAFAAKK